jgi:hypothetical protein
MQDLPSPEQTRHTDIPAQPIRLSDGNEWGFALPSLKLIPVVINESDDLGRQRETIKLQMAYGYPLDVRRLWDDLQHALEGGPPARQHEAFFMLAVSLLRRAHSLDLSTAAALLAVDVTDLPRLARAIMATAVGQELLIDGPPHDRITHDSSESG